jgi:hypothetical protein
MYRLISGWSPAYSEDVVLVERRCSFLVDLTADAEERDCGYTRAVLGRAWTIRQAKNLRHCEIKHIFRRSWKGPYLAEIVSSRNP